MTTRWLINLALASIAAWLAWLVFQDIQYSVSRGRLTDLDPAAVQRIELERSAGALIRLERSDDQWWMRAPLEAPADADAVARLLRIARARVDRVLPADATALGRLGLDPPRIRLELDGLRLMLGATEPVSARRYVMIGDLVQLIDDDQLRWLLAPPEQYLSRRLLPAGFQPAAGRIDGRALSAEALAGLVDVRAEQVQPLTGELGGRVVMLRAADSDQVLRFLVDDGGTRWTRLDQRLSYRLARPPLSETDEDAGQRSPLAPPSASGAPTDRRRSESPPTQSRRPDDDA